MGRPIQSFLQGQLDLLCGLYAITNALRWAMKDVSPLSRSSSVELISELTIDLQNRGKLASAFSNGMTIPDIGRSLKAADKWLRKETGYSVVIRKPHHGTATSSLKKIAFTVAQHLSHPNTSTIIVTSGRLDHWTVITGVNDKSFMLLDSEGQKFFRRQNCVCGPISTAEPSKLYLIPSSLFAITVQHDDNQH